MFDLIEYKKNLKSHFDSHIFSRGVDYYDSGSVKTLRAFSFKKEKIEIRGEIEGSEDYKASFVFDLKTNQFSDFECSCPYYDNCKHLVALGLDFISVLEDFDLDNEDFDDEFAQMSIEEFKKEIITYVNEGGKADAYTFDDFDEYQDDEEVSDTKIDKKDLLEELKVLIGMGDAPQVSIDKIVNKLAPYFNNSNNKNNISKDIANKYLDDKKVINNYGYNINDYFVCLFISSYDNRINDIKIKRNNFNNINIEELLNGCSNLNESQQELLETFKNFNRYGDNNYKKIFELIAKSGLRAYLSKDEKQKELKFLPQDKVEKIKAELNLENTLEYEEEEKKFVFRIDDSYLNKKNLFLIFDKNNVVKIDNGLISIYELSTSLIKILSRIKLDKKEYDHYYNYVEGQTKLEEEEILNINQIISESSKYLDFTTTLSPNYNIKKFTTNKPCVVVDYNKKTDLLNISAVIDYGFEKINVKESVSRRTYSGKDEYNRYISQKNIMKISDNNIFYAPIDQKKEIKLHKFFYDSCGEYGFKKNLECRHEGEKEVFRYFKKYWENIEKLDYDIHYVGDKFDFVSDDFKANFEVDLDAENDWLKFDVDCYCGQGKLTLADLQDYINNKKDFIKMKNGSFLNITNREELERFVAMLESFYANKGEGFQGKLYHAPELENIFTSSKHYNVKVEKSFEKFIKEAKSGKPVKKIKLPEKFVKILRNYQKEGIDWFYFLRKYRFAGILADDMGLGKTLQALVLLSKEKVKNKPSIVICPKTLLYNWKVEAEKFTPDLKTIVISGNQKERKALIRKAKQYDLIITGYATMQKDCEVYDKQKINFNYCILDEAQFIKNHTTKNARIVKKINADYRLALTGTPLENSVSEIWSIFDFLMPGFLGSYNNFVKKFQNPIMKNNSQTMLKHLQKKIECFMLRRTKDKVLKELPPKIENNSICQLGKDQNILYQEILASVKSEIFDTVRERGFEKSRIHILAGLTKLRQVCNHPVLLLKDKDYTKYQSAKLDMFSELIDEIVENKRKVLVFSQFTKMLDILAEELKKKKIRYNYLSGQTNNRQELVQDFNEDLSKQVFLISLKAGGVGLNLTSADNVIIFDPWWNPSVENQAIDRTHRIGQKNSVNVYRLITSGTIEERIVNLQNKKKFLFDSLVGESKDLFSKLTWEEIKGIFDEKLEN